MLLVLSAFFPQQENILPKIIYTLASEVMQIDENIRLH